MEAETAVAVMMITGRESSRDSNGCRDSEDAALMTALATAAEATM